MGTIKEENVDNYNEALENFVLVKEEPKPGEYKCYSCCLEFTSDERLENHYLECPHEQKELKPELIGAEVNLNYAVCKEDEPFKHRAEGCESNERPFKCTMCNYTAIWNSALKDHLFVKHHIGERKLERLDCTDCKYSTYRKQSLEKHTRTHTKERPFECGECDYAAAEGGSLKRYVSTKHYDGEKRYKCTVCDFSTFLKLKKSKTSTIYSLSEM